MPLCLPRHPVHFSTAIHNRTRQPQLAVDLTQQHHAAVAGDRTAVKCGLHAAALYGWKLDRGWGTNRHGGILSSCLPPGLILQAQKDSATSLSCIIRVRTLKELPHIMNLVRQAYEHQMDDGETA